MTVRMPTSNVSKSRTIVISDLDRKRLESLIQEYRRLGRGTWNDVKALESELSNAVTVAPSDIPADVVTMNSKVRLKIQGLGSATYTIVYPIDARLDDGRISIFAPLATAVLGYRVGDCITWNLPAGNKEIAIDALLYQPEAAGDHRR